MDSVPGLIDAAWPQQAVCPRCNALPDLPSAACTSIADWPAQAPPGPTLLNARQRLRLRWQLLPLKAPFKGVPACALLSPRTPLRHALPPARTPPPRLITKFVFRFCSLQHTLLKFRRCCTVLDEQLLVVLPPRFQLFQMHCTLEQTFSNKHSLCLMQVKPVH